MAQTDMRFSGTGTSPSNPTGRPETPLVDPVAGIVPGSAGPHTFGYICSESGPGELEDTAGHIAQLDAYGRARGLPLAAVFIDADDRSTPWPDRPAGKRLFAALRPGDAVVVRCMSEVAGSPSGFEGVVRLALARGAISTSSTARGLGGMPWDRS